MTRKVADCREFPSESNCTLTISGAATEHTVSVHQHPDTPELRSQLRGMLKPKVGPTTVR
jgi:hypothetical protein